MNGKMILFLRKKKENFHLDKHQSPGALARSSSANELALRRKNNLITPTIQSTAGRFRFYHRIYCVKTKKIRRSTTFFWSISSHANNVEIIDENQSFESYRISISTWQSFDITKFIEIISLSFASITYADKCSITNSNWFKWRIENFKSRIESRTNT